VYVNVSPYLIKPEAYACCGAIRARLEDAGLRIVFHKPYRLSAQDVEFLYAGVEPADLAALAEALCCGDVEIGLVTGVRAVERLLECSGRATDPGDCERGTIRREFGHLSARIICGRPIFLNAIHRPKSEAEARTSILYFGLPCSGCDE
jgi:nucleoside diphosphate kinase